MKTYNQLVAELDSSGAHYAQDLSEVDVSDPDDVKVLADDPRGEVLVHLGSSDFLERFKIYVSHVQEWRRQFARLDSVDLRYEHQIVVNPDLQGAAKQPPLSLSAVRAAMAAGVKPASLVSRELVKAPAGPAAASSAAKTSRKPVPAKKRVAKSRHRKALAKKTSVAARAGISPASITAKEPAAQPSAVQKTTSSGLAAASSTTKLSKPSPAIPKGQQQ
jgi:cell division protein FtsQ